jgi:hypothetical protein
VARVVSTFLDAPQIADALKAMGREGKELQRSALLSGGGPLLAAMRAGINSLTGLLAGGLSMRPGRGDRAGRVSVLLSSKTTVKEFASKTYGVTRAKALASGIKGRNYRVYYGLFVALGHKNPGHADVPPHDWYGQAFDSQAEGLLEVAADTLLYGMTERFAEAG